MLGLIYILLAFVLGYFLLKRFAPMLLNMSAYTGWSDEGARVPNWMVSLPSAWLLGSLIMTWVTYFACLALQGTAKPMLYGSHAALIVFLVLGLWLVRRSFACAGEIAKAALTRAFWRSNRLEKAYVLCAVLIASFLAFYTFVVKDNSLFVGFSVWSDFGPHLAVIRSFSAGDNFPTEYPHFPAGNIRYHFLFQFMAGVLETLGLRIDFAFNFPSILGLVSLFMLLYALAVVLTGRRSVGVIVGCLFIFRSSFAFFTFLKQIVPEGSVWSKIWNVGEHIGKTEHESWGLWAQNVYANQRHFAFSLSILILVLFMMLPLLRKMVLAQKARLDTLQNPPQAAVQEPEPEIGTPMAVGTPLTVLVDETMVAESAGIVAVEAVLSETTPGEDAAIATPEVSAATTGAAEPAAEVAALTRGQRFAAWASESLGQFDAWWPQSLGRACGVGLLLGAIGFWNGAVLIAALLILFVLGLASKHRLEFLIVAVIAVALAQFQSALFIGTDTSAVKPEITIGFLAQTKSLIGILSYFVELLGVMPFLLLLAVFVVPKGWRWLSLAFIAPLIFAVTMTLTPDVNANHKFIMIAVMLLNIPVAWLLHRWWVGGARELRILAATAFALLIVTGLVDLLTLFNINRNSVVLDLKNPVTVWARTHSQPTDIFLTDWSVLHPVQMAGRKIYFGWPYYAWSAGYDTRAREPNRNRIFSTTSGEEMKRIAREQGVRYIVVDNNVRESREYHVNEPLLKETFPQVFTTERDNTQIYKVY